MWGIRHHIFVYRHLTPDGVFGGFPASLWKFRPFLNNYALRIMNCELLGRPQGIAPTGKNIPLMDFHTIMNMNYEL